MTWNKTKKINNNMNDTQMQLIESKYGKLIHKIGHWISGDTAISAHDDNTQDIWIAAMEAIQGYSKKEDQSFDEFWGSVGFDKYIKTCMWNVKNSKGAKITKKFNITRDTVNIIDNEEVLQMADPKAMVSDLDIYLSDIANKITKEQAEAVKLLVRDPKLIKPSGKVNISALAKKLNKTWNETNSLMEDLGKALNNKF